jgi:hypothetical protein
MSDDPPSRKRIDLMALSPPARVVLVVATIAIVVGIALLVGNVHTEATVPISAIIAATLAFGFVAWRSQRR